MINNRDRSGWFGASDTAMIMGNWETKSFAKWWLVKCGVSKQNVTTLAMTVGTHLEHRILDYIGCEKRDRQVKIRRYRLRVNYDGEDRTKISEVKTHSAAKFRVSKAYWQQCQVEMFASKRWWNKRKRCRIVAYQTTEADYNNFFLPIDGERLSFHPIEYDAKWIKTQYLPRLKYLAKCLRAKKWPRFEEIREAKT